MQHYAKWAALALFVIVTLMAQQWGLSGAIAAFLALTLFAVLYALDETALIREAEKKKRDETEAQAAAAAETEKKEARKQAADAATTERMEGTVELRSLIFDRGAEERKLFEAVRNGDLAEVTRLVESGTALDAENQNGITPLMFAAKFGQVDIAAYLIEQGADVNKKAKNGLTAMRIAREQKISPIMELLAAGGALD